MPTASLAARKTRVIATVVAMLLAAALLGLAPPATAGVPRGRGTAPDLSAPPDVPPGLDAPFRVGTGVASTSPLEQICIGGYGTFCNRPSQGEKDPLQARALAISSAADPDDGIVVVTATAVGLFTAYKPELGPSGITDIRRRIAARTGVPAEKVVVVSDHSHAAPDTIGIWGGVDRDYMTILADGIVDAGVQAWHDRQPAELSWAAVDTTAHGYALDSSYDLGPTDDAAMDNEFRVLFADTPTGHRIATFVNYAPHATVCGDCDDQLSGDWTAWAAQESEAMAGGTGFGAVGALGSTDWNKSGDLPAREGEARTRLRILLTAATAARTPVVGDEVDGRSVFIYEPVAQPVLDLNLLPGISDPTGLSGSEGEIRIDRAITPPYLTGQVMGTYGGALRVGDLAIALFPGEPFPQLHDLLRGDLDDPDGDTPGIDASAVFLLGAAQDFLGYMTADQESYQQTLEEGALYLAGCPEEEVYDHAGHDHDGACPDHWTLQVSPTIGLHLVCTAQDAAEAMGLPTGPRDQACAALTAADGTGDPLATPSPPTSSPPTPPTVPATPDTRRTTSSTGSTGALS